MRVKEQHQTVQDRKKGTERVQTKLGKTHVDYWYGRLIKRTYVGRDGTEVEIPFWQVRLKSGERALYFNLGTTNRAVAAVKARDIYVYLKANGCDATLKQFKPEAQESSDDLAAQKDLVTILGQFDPKLVKMAPHGERAED